MITRRHRRNPAGRPRRNVLTPELWDSWFGVRYIPEPNTGCWLWAGNLDTPGYGQISSLGRKVLAHRLSYIFLRGPIPRGLQIDHLCRVRSCVNPDHMELVTSRENASRGRRSRAKR